jgi:hypothetical protein
VEESLEYLEQRCLLELAARQAHYLLTNANHAFRNRSVFVRKSA